LLRIIIPEQELYDEGKEEFIYSDEQSLQLEHSLVSISKWEAKWGKPFLNAKDKTVDEVIDYVRCMTINKNIDNDLYERLTESNLRDINAYIESSMTATTFKPEPDSPNREVITSELIYYWMVSYNIPFECEKWHLNRLLTLIRVCNVKNTPPKKTSKQELINRNRELNRARKEQFNTSG
jgi:hypothetical protein